MTRTIWVKTKSPNNLLLRRLVKFQKFKSAAIFSFLVFTSKQFTQYRSRMSKEHPCDEVSELWHKSVVTTFSWMSYLNLLPPTLMELDLPNLAIWLSIAWLMLPSSTVDGGDAHDEMKEGWFVPLVLGGFAHSFWSRWCSSSTNRLDCPSFCQLPST